MRSMTPVQLLATHSLEGKSSLSRVCDFACLKNTMKNRSY